MASTLSEDAMMRNVPMGAPLERSPGPKAASSIIGAERLRNRYAVFRPFTYTRSQSIEDKSRREYLKRQGNPMLPVLGENGTLPSSIRAHAEIRTYV